MTDRDVTPGRYSLGLGERDRVDQAFGGGFPAGSLVLVEGGHGAGKSVLAQRFSYGMATEGTCVSYLSTEETAGSFLDQMDSMAYDVVDFLLSERLLFLRADLDTHADDGGRAVGTRELLSRLVAARRLWRADVTVLDGFHALVRNDPRYDASAAADDEDHLLEAFVAFLGTVTATDRTVVLTVNPDAVGERALQPLRDAADVSLAVEANTVGSSVRRSVRVRRFAGMRDPVDDSIGFTVQQGRGVVIESRTVA
jgi:flagellar protein FlaH